MMQQLIADCKVSPPPSPPPSPSSPPSPPLPSAPRGQFTLLAYKNVDLLKAALTLLAASPSCSQSSSSSSSPFKREETEGEEDPDLEYLSQTPVEFSQSPPSPPVSQASHQSLPPLEYSPQWLQQQRQGQQEQQPAIEGKEYKQGPRRTRPIKIAINGAGANSGISKWKKIGKDLESFYQVYAGHSSTIDVFPWNDDGKGGMKHVGWKEISKEIADSSFLLSLYAAIIDIINAFGSETLEKFEEFRSTVMDQV